MSGFIEVMSKCMNFLTYDMTIWGYTFNMLQVIVFGWLASVVGYIVHKIFE